MPFDRRSQRFPQKAGAQGKSGSPSTSSPRSSGQAGQALRGSGQAGLPFGRLRASRTPNKSSSGEVRERKQGREKRAEVGERR